MGVDKTIFIYENYIYSERGESKMNDSQKMKWYTLAFMCFSTLWGFGNVLNGVSGIIEPTKKRLDFTGFSLA